MSVDRDYWVCLTTAEDLPDYIADAAEHVASHKCAIGQPVEWRCDPMPGAGEGLFQLHVSWPCEGAE